MGRRARPGNRAACWAAPRCRAGRRSDGWTAALRTKDRRPGLSREARGQAHLPGGKGTDSLWLTLFGDEGAVSTPRGLLRVDPISGAGSAFLPLSQAQAGDGFQLRHGRGSLVGRLGGDQSGGRRLEPHRGDVSDRPGQAQDRGGIRLGLAAELRAVSDPAAGLLAVGASAGAVAGASPLEKSTMLFWHAFSLRATRVRAPPTQRR